jgi:hypothetical protein
MDVLKEVLTEVLIKLTKEEHTNLLFLVYKKLLSDLLVDKQNQDVQSMINNQDREQLKIYVEKRYFA